MQALWTKRRQRPEAGLFVLRMRRSYVMDQRAEVSRRTVGGGAAGGRVTVNRRPVMA